MTEVHAEGGRWPRTLDLRLKHERGFRQPCSRREKGWPRNRHRNRHRANGGRELPVPARV